MPNREHHSRARPVRFSRRCSVMSLKQGMQTVCSELGISSDLPLHAQVEEANRVCGLPGSGSLAAQVKALVRAVTTIVEAEPIVETATGVQVVEAVIVEEPVEAPPPGPAARAAEVLRSGSSQRLRREAKEARAAARAAAAAARRRAAENAQAAASASKPPANTGPMAALTMNYTPLADTFGVESCCFRVTPRKLVVFQFILTCLWVGFGFQDQRFNTGGQQNELYPYPSPPPPPLPDLPSSDPDYCPFDLVACNLHCARQSARVKSNCRNSSPWTVKDFEAARTAAQRYQPGITDAAVMQGLPGTLLNVSSVNNGVCERRCEVSCACGVDARHVASGGDCHFFIEEYPWYVGIHLAISIFSTIGFLCSYSALSNAVTKILKAPRIRHSATQLAPLPPLFPFSRLAPPPPSSPSRVHTTTPHPRLPHFITLCSTPCSDWRMPLTCRAPLPCGHALLLARRPDL